MHAVASKPKLARATDATATDLALLRRTRAGRRGYHLPLPNLPQARWWHRRDIPRRGGRLSWPRVRVVSLSRAGVAHQNFRRWWQSVVCGECGVWRVSVCKISFSWGKFQQQQRSGNKHTVSRGQFVCGRSGLLTMGTMLHGRGSAVSATRGQTGHTCARDRALTVKLLVNSVQTPLTGRL